MKKITGKQLITIFATLAVIGVNIAANALPLNGLDTGEISDRFDIYFVPAGYVFSIWLFIYVGLILYTIYQAAPSRAEDPVLNKIAPYYWLSSVANIVWLFLWHYEVFSITLVAMLAILVNLIFISRFVLEADGAVKWYVRLPFSIYLGWISVATIANATQTLYYFDWAGWGIGTEVWAVILLAVASLLGILKTWLENDTPYALVLIWAFIGITVSQVDSALVSTAAWVTSGVVLVGIIVSGLKFKKLY